MTVVVAIDLGTSRSAWAFSIQGRGEDTVSLRIPVGSEPSPSSEKTETAVLLSPDDHEVLAFGNAAHGRYLEKIEGIEDVNVNLGTGVGPPPKFAASNTKDHVQGRPMLFRWFKMELCTNGGFHTVNDPVAISECGRTLPLLVVMSAVLRHFKEDALANFSSIGELNDSMEDVLWVVTIPAIYDDFARRFMRVAAHQAGLINKVNSPRLRLCLEPEAACLTVRFTESPEKFQLGNQTMIVDCGGGTVDITTYEVLSVDPLRLKELCKPTGGPWGSTYVDSEFIAWLKNLLGKQIFTSVRGRLPFLDLLRQWEDQKMRFGGMEDEFVRLNMAGFTRMEDGEPVFDVAKMQELRVAYNKSHMGNDGWQVRGENFIVILPSPLVRSFFEPIIDKISTCLHGLKSDPSLRDIKYVFLVGGFSSSPLVEAAARSALEHDGCHVMVPPRPEAAIAKGAVLYANNANVFHIRKARLTYGVKTIVPFDPHNPEHCRRENTEAVQSSDEGPAWVYRFSRHLEYLDDIPLDGSCDKLCYRPPTSTQSEAIVEILASHQRDIRFADSATTFPLGVVIVPLDMDAGFGNRAIEVQFVFGGTEITVNCFRQTTGEQVGEAILEFLQEET